MQTPTNPMPDLRWAIDRCGANLAERTDVQRLAHHVEELSSEARRQFFEALDEHQIPSKLWLIEELRKHRDLAAARLVVLGAWYGVLPLLVNWQLASPPRRMTCIDIDAAACALGERVIGSVYANIDYQHADVMQLDYVRLGADPDVVIINTICEHLPDFPGWRARLPAGQLVALQSNNYFACPDHVNAVPSVAAFSAQAQLRRTLFEGRLPLRLMDRYMLIGYS